MTLQPDDEFNRALQSFVHPSDWQNPRPSGRYNLVVLGGGTAGLVTAAAAAGLGAKVALVEKHLLGGDCLNVGCVPSKALLSAAHAVHAVRRASEFGIDAEPASVVNFPAVMQRMRKLRASIAHNDSAARFRELGVDVFLGEGKFTSPAELEVAGARLRFARAVVATGARAAAPQIQGLQDVGFLTNETVFSLTELPKRLGIIGAGPIGCEMAQAFRRFGSQVTVFGKDKCVLPREEAPARELLAAALRREGIALELGVDVVSVIAVDGGKQIAFKSTSGATQTVAVDEILVAAGRAPNVEGLGLETVGVTYDLHSGIKVDDQLRTTNRSIFAAGDVTGGYQFTHAADAMARIVIKNALFFGRQRCSALVVPWATYTDPEVARVGISADEAKRRGIHVTTHEVEMRSVDRAILEGNTEGFARIHVDPKGYILGATIVARHAGDLIPTVVLAMTNRLKLGRIGGTIFPYPTQAEVVKKLADTANRGRLTPRLKRIFTRLLRWRR